MSYKKKKSAADDLIESLLEDVKSSEEGTAFSSSASHELDDQYSDNEDDPNNAYAEKGDDEFAIVEDKFSIPNIELSKNIGGYKGPSIDGGYQSPLDIGIPSDSDAVQIESSDLHGISDLPVASEATEFASEASGASDVVVLSSDSQDDRTVNMNESSVQTSTKDDRTIAAPAFAKSKPQIVEEKVVIGAFKGPSKSGLVHTSVDASLAQAENLKIAQSRILELEKEVEKMRQENEDLAVAAQIVRKKTEELSQQVAQLENEKNEIQDSLHEEVGLLKNSLAFKENEVITSKNKIEELDARLKNDFKKIRVRERELENRLELARAEKQSLVQAKDEIILNLQRKIDQYKSELDAYKGKVSELNRTVESYQDQTKRTMRALRLAMTNMEVKDIQDEPVTPLKKAE